MSMIAIKNVILNFTRVNHPELMYQRKVDPNNKLVNHEYVTDVLMPAKAMKKLKADFRKAGVKALKSTRTFDADEYKKAYLVDAPEGDEYLNSDGLYETIKFRQSAAYPNGEPVEHRPEVIGFKSEGGKSKNGYDVGVNVPIGNGTLANLQLRVRPYVFEGAKGTSLDLWATQIIDLVPYEGGGLLFDDAGEGEAPEDEEFDSAFDDAGEDTSVPESDSSDDSDEEDDDDWDE